ncbi:MAG: hypothetical protein AB8U94_02630 [Francisella endosymbiont of Hyalomma asiaticum]
MYTLFNFQEALFPPIAVLTQLGLRLIVIISEHSAANILVNILRVALEIR